MGLAPRVKRNQKSRCEDNLDPLDARWRRPRKLKELETLKPTDALAAADSIVTRHRRQVMPVKSAGRILSAHRSRSGDKIKTNKHKKESAGAFTPAAIPFTAMMYYDAVCASSLAGFLPQRWKLVSLMTGFVIWTLTPFTSLG